MISNKVIHLSYWQDPVDAGPCASAGQDYPLASPGVAGQSVAHWQDPADAEEHEPGTVHGRTRPTDYLTEPDAFAGCSTREGEPAPFGGGGPLAKPERHKMPKTKKRVNQP